jgi:hypothetical protein
VAALPFGRANDLPDMHPEYVAVEADRRVQVGGHERNVMKATPLRGDVDNVATFGSHDISFARVQRFI